MNYLYVYIFILTNIYFLLDLHSIGNVLFRKDADNKYRFMPMSIFNCMCAPFQYKEYWTTCLIRSNYIFLLLSNIIIYLLINYLIEANF